VEYTLILIKATPRKERLSALYAICLQIFRHSTQKSLDIREYACGIFMHSDKKSVGASDAQSLCSIALKIKKQNIFLSGSARHGISCATSPITATITARV
jgi:hypothetical protein